MKNLLLTSILAISLTACVEEPTYKPIEDCVNVVTGEKVIFDHAKVTKRTNGLFSSYIQFEDENGYRHTVGSKTIEDWKCKPRR